MSSFLPAGSRHGFAAMGAVAVVFVILAAALGSLIVYRGAVQSATPTVTTNVLSSTSATTVYTSSVTSTASGGISVITSSSTSFETSTITSYPVVTTGLLVPPNSTQVVIISGASEGPCPGGCFTPDNVTVVIGVNNTVVWLNSDSTYHTVTADLEAAGPGGTKIPVFNSGWIPPKALYYWTFTTVGDYEYFCDIHPWMEGSVIVKASSS